MKKDVRENHPSIHKVHEIDGRFFVVIDTSLVKRLNIDNGTWLEEKDCQEGLLLMIRKDFSVNGLDRSQARPASYASPRNQVGSDAYHDDCKLPL